MGLPRPLPRVQGERKRVSALERKEPVERGSVPAQVQAPPREARSRARPRRRRDGGQRGSSPDLRQRLSGDYDLFHSSCRTLLRECRCVCRHEAQDPALTSRRGSTATLRQLLRTVPLVKELVAWPFSRLPCTHPTSTQSLALRLALLSSRTPIQRQVRRSDVTSPPGAPRSPRPIASEARPKSHTFLHRRRRV
jgi:hypothetical protein